ncbi:MAG: hypothetical protein M3Y67_08830 [Pseudomonadota bacterium]|nr:hypothetical protein [Pseudomonadota bacterium]
MPPAGAIEWEELPSLVDTLSDRLIVLGSRPRQTAGAAPRSAETASCGQPWDATRPADLEPPPPPQPFREAFNGLAIREVTEPDVFRHFFGSLRSL